ncbi:MAG: DUF2007 domain-containing protein [Bacteroidota bacterium]
MLDKERTTILATYYNEIDAEIAKDFLRAEGISAYVSKDDSGGMDPHFQLTRGVRVVIMERDAERALAVLQALQDGYDEGP